MSRKRTWGGGTTSQVDLPPPTCFSTWTGFPGAGAPMTPRALAVGLPGVPMSRRSNVQASGSSSVQASGSSSVPISRRCNISACGCPDTCTSQSPDAQAAQHRDFQGSEPPRHQTPQVQTTTTSVSPGPKTPRSQGPPHWTDFRQGLRVSRAKDAVKHGPGSATVSMTPNARSPDFPAFQCPGIREPQRPDFPAFQCPGVPTSHHADARIPALLKAQMRRQPSTGTFRGLSPQGLRPLRSRPPLRP